MAAIASPRQLTPFGVELVPSGSVALDIDPLELRRLLMRDGLLVMRGLDLTMEERRELCRAFGPVHESPFENFYISNTRADGFLGSRELQWHNDVPYLPSPYRYAALHAIEVDDQTTSTRFVSGLRGYDRLPAPLRERIDGMTALQVRQRVADRANRLEDLWPGDLCTVHSVVREQRETGRKYVFVNENMTACVIGLERRESDALLAEIFEHLYAADAVYDHVWRPGDLVVWDNLAVQHARGAVGTGARTLQRVTCTDFTYLEQYPADNVGEGLHNERLFEESVAL